MISLRDLRIARCHGYENTCACYRCRDRSSRFQALLRLGFTPSAAAKYAEQDSADRLGRHRRARETR